MTVSYDVNNVGSDDTHTVRFLIQDTDTSDAILEDEEIDWILTNFSSVYYAAAEAADVIATHYSRRANYEAGELAEDLSDLSEKYERRAERLRERASDQAAIKPRLGGDPHDAIADINWMEN